MSATSIEKGTRRREEIGAALDTAKAGIICLTPENLNSPWLLFEAGALFKTLDTKSRVWTYLLAGLQPENLKDPLAMFQATKPDKEDTKKFVLDIRNYLDPSLPDSRVNHLFEKLWSDLDAELTEVNALPGAPPPTRNRDEMITDTLDLLRSLAPLIAATHVEAQNARAERVTAKRVRNYIAQPANAVNAAAIHALGTKYTTLPELMNLNSLRAESTEPKPEERHVHVPGLKDHRPRMAERFEKARRAKPSND